MLDARELLHQHGLPSDRVCCLRLRRRRGLALPLQALLDGGEARLARVRLRVAAGVRVRARVRVRAGVRVRARVRVGAGVRVRARVRVRAGVRVRARVRLDGGETCVQLRGLGFLCHLGCRRCAGRLRRRLSGRHLLQLQLRTQAEPLVACRDLNLEHLGRWRGDGGEMAGRWWGDGGEMVGRWGGLTSP